MDLAQGIRENRQAGTRMNCWRDLGGEQSRSLPIRVLVVREPILSRDQSSAEGDAMTSESASAYLRYALLQHTEKIREPKSTVLFRRGDRACGMFVVLTGRVSLHLGVDSIVGRSYGAGALIGLPSTLTRQNYSMTATVTEDAELGFLPPEALESLLRQHPDLYPPLLFFLGEKIAESRENEGTLLDRRVPETGATGNRDTVMVACCQAKEVEMEARTDD